MQNPWELKDRVAGLEWRRMLFEWNARPALPWATPVLSEERIFGIDEQIRRLKFLCSEMMLEEYRTGTPVPEFEQRHIQFRRLENSLEA